MENGQPALQPRFEQQTQFPQPRFEQQQPLPAPPPQAWQQPAFAPQQRTAAPAAQQGGGGAAPISTASESIDRSLGTPGNAAPVARVTGWRAFLSYMGIHAGPSAKERDHAALIGRIRAENTQFRITSVISDAAGGTMLVGALGQVLNRNRSEDAVAVDLDPEGGDLDLVTASQPSGKNARTLLNEEKWQDKNRVYSHMSVTKPGTDLHVVASPWRYTNKDVLDFDDVVGLYDTLRPHFNVGIVDAGRSLLTETARGVLYVSSALILPAAPTTRSVRRVARIIDWLRHHGYHGLLANTIVVINHTKRNGHVTVEQFDELFRAGQKLRVLEIPFDPHLDEADGPVDIDELKPATLRAIESLAAEVASTFGSGYITYADADLAAHATSSADR